MDHDQVDETRGIQMNVNKWRQAMASTKRNFLYLLICLTGAACAQVQTAPIVSKTYQWKARLAFYSQDGTHLLVTLCKYGSSRFPTMCRPWRYHLTDKRWEEIALSPSDPDWDINSASYSPDGKTIAASYVKCQPSTGQIARTCPYLDYRLLLIDAATGTHRTIASENARFQPSFTPDGKSLVYWQLDNLQGVATGTTAMPARQAQTLYATHNIHTLQLGDGQERLAIAVKAQLPLAPPRVFPDGVRVTVSGMGVIGAVTTPEGVYKGMWGVEQAIERDDSYLIGNLQTGEMKAPLPRGYPLKEVFDVSSSNAQKQDQLIYKLRNDLYVTDSEEFDPIKLTPTFASGTLQYNRPIDHASFAPDGKSFVYVFGYELATAPVRANTTFEILKRPDLQLP
jgi:WD40-like Beta Propeller Repeat